MCRHRCIVATIVDQKTIHHLFFVIGAPSAGKSTVCAAMAETAAMGIAAFDMDDLLLAASNLTGSDPRVDEQRWPAYNALWLTAMRSVSNNDILPVLFCPLTPEEAGYANATAHPDLAQLHQLLLDCADTSRRKRLAGRFWAEVRMSGACADAAELERAVDLKLSTGRSRAVPTRAGDCQLDTNHVDLKSI